MGLDKLNFKHIKADIIDAVEQMIAFSIRREAQEVREGKRAILFDFDFVLKNVVFLQVNL